MTKLSDQLEREVFNEVESRSVTQQRPKASLVFATRIRPSDLATLTRYFAEEGENLTGASQVLRLACETLAEILRRKDSKFEFSTLQACSYLEDLGLVSGRDRKNSVRLFRAKQLEVLLEERQANKPADPELESVQLYREACRTLAEMGETPSAEQLELAKLVILDGQLVEVEWLLGKNSS